MPLLQLGPSLHFGVVALTRLFDFSLKERLDIHVCVVEGESQEVTGDHWSARKRARVTGSNRRKTEFHLARKLSVRLRREFRNERFFRLGIKSCAFVKVKCGLILPTSHQHHFVTALGPRKFQCLSQQRFPVALAPVLRMGNNIFN